MIRAGSVAHHLLAAACAEPQTLPELRACVTDRARRTVSVSAGQQTAATLIRAGYLCTATTPQRGIASAFILTAEGEAELDRLFAEASA